MPVEAGFSGDRIEHSDVLAVYVFRSNHSEGGNGLKSLKEMLEASALVTADIE
jgi:hypothetical protein